MGKWGGVRGGFFSFSFVILVSRTTAFAPEKDGCGTCCCEEDDSIMCCCEEGGCSTCCCEEGGCSTCCGCEADGCSTSCEEDGCMASCGCLPCCMPVSVGGVGGGLGPDTCSPACALRPKHSTHRSACCGKAVCVPLCAVVITSLVVVEGVSGGAASG